MKLVSKRNKNKNKELIELPQQETIVEPVVTESQPDILIPEDYKQCFKCNKIKPLSSYYKSHYGNPIRQCKICHKQY